ncbi:reverse transcriptase domain-containing protein [Tanacetum coccineum]
MSTHSGPSPTAPTSAIQNTVGKGKEVSQENLNWPTSNAALREYCDKHYNQLFPILVEKMHQEKVQQEKLKAVKARLNFEDVSQHSESGTSSRRRDLKKRIGSKPIRSMSGSPEPRRSRSESPRKRDPERKTVFKRLEKGVFHKGCIPHARRQVRRVWFDDIPAESVDSYDDLKKAFLENYLQQKKCIKYLIEIHNIKQRDVESTKDFVRRYKLESRDVKGASECMKIFEFMHGITNPELIKREQLPEIAKVRTKAGTIYSSHKIPKRNLALDKGKFKTPPPMTTPVEKINNNKFCEFHGEVGHNTDECMHLKRQIEELLKAGKLSHVIKELKQNSGKDQPKMNKKGEAANKDKALAIRIAG